MTVDAGTNLGPYRVVSLLGKGGMGEVWLAHDPRLRRDVAIKTVFDSMRADTETTARFEREARLLGSLNHPGIAAVYGFERFEDRFCLVFEYVPGETLLEIIARGRLDITESLRLALQLASALEAAHSRGIVHRDLKPANIKVTPEGQLKTLDFGLAKGTSEQSQVDSADVLGTITMNATRQGHVLGTPAYMSPEQARGKPVDCQTDIWSFGCILFEMLSGQQAFQGETVTDLLVTVLQREPNWEQLPADVPQDVVDLIVRCTKKDKRERLHAIADVRIELESLLRAPGESGSIRATSASGAITARLRAARGSSSRMAAVAVVASLATGGATWFITRKAPLPAPVVAALLTPKGLQAGEFGSAAAISNDGSRMVFAVHTASSTALVRRQTDRIEFVPIPGTDGAAQPFFSPDGTQVGYFADGKLKKTMYEGGPVLTICDAPSPHGATWGPDDLVVFVPESTGGLMVVPSTGGVPRALTSIARGQSERHRLPRFLPSGRTVIFTVHRGAAFFDAASIEAISLDGKRTPVLRGGFDAQYSSGNLIFARGGALHAVPFDPDSLQTKGPAKIALDGVLEDPVEGSVQYSLSGSGTLVYIPPDRSASEGTIMSVDRHGTGHPLIEARKAFFSPRYSSDGKRVAVTVAEGDNRSLWVADLKRGSLTRLTLRSGVDGFPVWSPDAAAIAYTSDQPGPRNLYRIAADGSGQPERLATSNFVQIPCQWSPDGRVLLYEEGNAATNWDIWALPFDDAGKPGTPRAVIQTPYSDTMPALSADGKWLAWVSDESGRSEVYVRSFPVSGPKLQVSTSGGSQPVWSRKGTELFFRQGDRVFSAKVTTSPKLEAEPAQLLFAADFDQGRRNTTNYDTSPVDGVFVVIRGGDPVAGQDQQMNLLVNWAANLKSRLTTAVP